MPHRAPKPAGPAPTKTTYTSTPVPLPPDFLRTPLINPCPTLTRLDFSTTSLPEYKACTALILDNILTSEECATLLSLAEASAASTSNDANIPPSIAGSPPSGWRPALVNAGAGREILSADYRNSDRIIWDDAEVVERIWGRCVAVEGVWEVLGGFLGGEEGREGQKERAVSVLGWGPVRRGKRYRFTRVNERMRFLRYGKGQFFEAHCDGSYVNPNAKVPERSLVTLQLYLNNDPDLRGGATAFHSMDGRAGRVDVLPEPGRVLLFQHRGLVHSGEEVTAGLKYTMRTDLMYELVVEE